MGRVLLIGFLFISFLTSAQQLPIQLQGIDPATVTPEQLEKLGVSKEDIAKFQQKLNEKEAPKAEEVKVKEEKKEKVEGEEKEAKEEEKPADKEVQKNDPKEIFGKNFFKYGSLEIFKSASHVKAPDEYILGVGDELSISIWGYSEASEVLQIEADGSVTARRVGKIYLNGMPFGEARKTLINRYGAAYNLNNSQIAIELNYSKVIRVNIVGEVNKPGTYSVSSINSAFNVISLAGGITNLGSVRNIIIKRDNKVVRTLDVYKFLQDPNFKNDFFLNQNDYIIVQPAGTVVEIIGAIGRTGKYELIAGEGISDLIKYAGGLNSNAYAKTVHVKRIDSTSTNLIDVSLQELNEGKKTFKLKNGDEVEIAEVKDVLRNYVTVSGALRVNGNFEFIKGEKITGLIERAKGLNLNAFLGRAYVIRSASDNSKSYIQLNLKNIMADKNSAENIELQEFDEFKVFESNDFVDEFYVEISGAVREPQKMIYSENITLKDLVFFAGGLKPEAANKRIEISRIANFAPADGNDEPTRIVVEVVEVSNDLDLMGTTEIRLMPFDHVYVRTVPDFEFQKTMILTGEVKYPGTYVILRKDETIKEIIERAGGLTEWAFLEGAKMSRKGDGTEMLNGSMILDLDAMYKGKKEFNYVVQDGDELTIPKTNSLVMIEGEIDYPGIADIGKIITPYKKGKNAYYYVDNYGGGFTKKADKKLYVLSAGGHVKRTRTFLGIRFYPKVKNGDKIVVDPKPEKITKEKKGQEIDWNKIISDIQVKATALVTFYIVLKNVNW